MPSSPKIIFPLPKKDAPLLFEFYNKNFPNSQWSQEYWNKLFDNTKKNILVGLKTDTRYIGLVLGEISRKDKSRLTISAIAIELEFRRNGYGTILVKNFLAIAFDKAETEKIVLHFRGSNKTNLVRFYAELGFKNSCKDGLYSNGEDKYQLEMTKAHFRSLS